MHHYIVMSSLHKNLIKDLNFSNSELVLVRNSQQDRDIGSKTKLWYSGPIVVVWWLKKGSYVLAKIVRLANSKAGIKPTAPLSAFDKENSIEFLLDSLYYLYNYYMVCTLLSHAYHVTYHVTPCDVMLWLPVMWLWLCNTCDVILSCTSFCVVSPR